MPSFSRAIRFEAEDASVLWAELGAEFAKIPEIGSKIEGFRSLDELSSGATSQNVTIKKLLSPVPQPRNPIYCVGLNYKSHSAEAGLAAPQDPPLWPKPAAALANPDEPIEINQYCAKSLLDYEGELIFITSKDCKDVSEADASSYILGWTIGNDLSCRAHQAREKQAGQFYFAKAFDKFAPVGPVLVSAAVFDNQKDVKILTKVNGEVRQNANVAEDMIFKPARILSHMSQGTTIPAGTAIMTGTPAGVGLFMEPKNFLQHGDVVEISIDGIGSLKNTIVFE